jgi:hypothetical protein
MNSKPHSNSEQSIARGLCYCNTRGKSRWKWSGNKFFVYLYPYFCPMPFILLAFLHNSDVVLQQCCITTMLYYNNEWSWAISSFRRDGDEICALLGYYTVLSGNNLPTFRDNLSVPSSRIGYPGTSVRNYHSTLRSIPEECGSRWTISCVCNMAPFEVRAVISMPTPKLNIQLVT